MTVTADALSSDATKRIADFDMSVVPGGMPSLLHGFVSEKKPEDQFVKDFSELQQRGAEERVLLSMCTGALLVAAVGSFEGLQATTHHMFEMDGDIDVVNCLGSDGTRRICRWGAEEGWFEGRECWWGCGCGMDAALYFGELKVGREAGEFVAKMAEYDWKRI